MEFEIKNLDFESFIKQADCLIDTLNNIEADLCRIARAVEAIAQEMVAENETL